MASRPRGISFAKKASLVTNERWPAAARETENLAVELQRKNRPLDAKDEFLEAAHFYKRAGEEHQRAQMLRLDSQ